MRLPLFKRLIITTCNIIFPPLAVALLTGFTSTDTFLNSCLFLLAVIPSHIHGFYIAIVYFTRKRRARRGRYPGKSHKAGIWSERVLTGGIGWKEADRLKNKSVKNSEKSDGGDMGTATLGRTSTERSQRGTRKRQNSRRVSRM